MTIAIRILAALPGLLFIGNGIQWLVDPAAVAESLGMELLTGIGASTQIGDLGSFFFVTGIFIIAGQLPGKSHLFYPPACLLAGAAVFRTLAYLLGHADFAGAMIGPEVVMTAILLLAARRLAAEERAASTS
ncbi:MAG: hypothetical protein VX246_09835 [Myxococcota bacterium]|nr:hypothetical protein [Myxococcota bacterium]